MVQAIGMGGNPNYVRKEYGPASNRLLKNYPKGTLWIDGGDVWSKDAEGTDASAWTQIESGGARKVAATFCPSQDYVTDLTMDDTVQVVALASDVKLGGGAVTLENMGATTEDAFFAFLTSDTDTEDYLGFSTDHATSGIRLQPYADRGVLCKTDPLRVPLLATHIAVCNGQAGDTHTIQLVQGVLK